MEEHAQFEWSQFKKQSLILPEPTLVTVCLFGLTAFYGVVEIQPPSPKMISAKTKKPPTTRSKDGMIHPILGVSPLGRILR